MGESQFSRIAMWLADPRHKPLPSALLQELDNVCGAVVLCGPDSQLDNALEKAMRAGADADTHVVPPPCAASLRFAGPEGPDRPQPGGNATTPRDTTLADTAKVCLPPSSSTFQLTV